MEGVYDWQRTNLPVHHVTTVNIDRLTGDVLGLGRGEKDGHRGDVFGFLPAVQGDELFNLLGGPGLVGRSPGFGLLAGPGFIDAAVEWRLDHAGAERVNPNTGRGKILGGTLGEIDQGGLGGAVGRVGLRADLAGDRGEKEHRA